MIYFFIGFFFIFIDWPIAVGAGEIDVFPNLLGYLLLLFGARAIKGESRRATPIAILSGCLLAISVAELVLSLLGVLGDSTLAAVLSVLVTLLFLYLAYLLCAVAKEMEAKRQRPIGAGKLETAWGFLAVGALVAYAPLFLPSLTLTAFALQILSYVWFERSLYTVYVKTK